MARRSRVGTAVALTMPLVVVAVTVTVTVTVTAALVVAEVTPASADSSAAGSLGAGSSGAGSSPTPDPSPSAQSKGLLGLLPTALPSLLPTALPTISLPTLPSLPLPTPSLPSLLLPTSPAAPGSTQSATPQPGGSSPGTAPAGGSSPGTSPKSGSGTKSSSGAASPGSTSAAASSAPAAFSPEAPPPAVSLLPANPVGYALPVPASVVATDPALIGEGASAPVRAEPAGPVTIAVPPGTAVDAVTAGTARAIPAGNGTSSVVLSGADGATYTYRNVLTSLPVAPARTAAVTAGTPIGTSGPGGLTFSISVPDVHGLVDADEAMQGWASGLSPDVRALPSGIASSVSAPTRDQVLLLTSSGAPGAGASGAGASGTGAPGTAASGASTSAITAALAKSLAGPLVQVRDATLDGSTTSGSTTSGSTTPDGTTLGEAALAGAVDRQIAASGSPALTIITLPDGTPAEAASLASALPASRQLLWIAPPGTTAKQAAAYRAIVAGHPGFRVESLPAALGQGKTGSAQARDLATATLISSYASAAYRLRSFSSQPDAVLSWAEAQLGKPASGLTTDAFAQAGIALPQGAAAQWQQTNGRPVADNKLTPGDLVFFAGPESAPGQVGIYAGNGEVIDSSSSRTASSRTASSGTTSSGTVRFQPLTAVSDYTGSTDPYTPVPESALASGLGSWLTAPVAALAVPGALSEYQSFARQLSDSTWGPSQFPYLYELWERESGWNPAALNPVSGAFGIPQSLPAGKMAAAGPDWASDAYTQIIWGIDYISATYGDPQAAWSHEVANNWY